MISNAFANAGVCQGVCQGAAGNGMRSPPPPSPGAYIQMCRVPRTWLACLAQPQRHTYMIHAGGASPRCMSILVIPVARDITTKPCRSCLLDGTVAGRRAHSNIHMATHARAWLHTRTRTTRTHTLHASWLACSSTVPAAAPDAFPRVPASYTLPLMAHHGGRRRGPRAQALDALSLAAASRASAWRQFDDR